MEVRSHSEINPMFDGLVNSDEHHSCWCAIVAEWQIVSAKGHPAAKRMAAS